MPWCILHESYNKSDLRNISPTHYQRSSDGISALVTEVIITFHLVFCAVVGVLQKSFLIEQRIVWMQLFPTALPDTVRYPLSYSVVWGPKHGVRNCEVEAAIPSMEGVVVMVGIPRVLFPAFWTHTVKFTPGAWYCATTQVKLQTRLRRRL